MKVSLMFYLSGIVAIGLVGVASIFFLFGLVIPASQKTPIYFLTFLTFLTLAVEILARAIWSETTTLKDW